MEFNLNDEVFLSSFFDFADKNQLAIILISKNLKILKMSALASIIISDEEIINAKEIFSDQLCNLIKLSIENKTQQSYFEELDDELFNFNIVAYTDAALLTIKYIEQSFASPDELSEPYQSYISRMLLATDLLIKGIDNPKKLRYLASIKQNTYRILRMVKHNNIKNLPLHKIPDNSKDIFIIDFFEEIVSKLNKSVASANIKIESPLVFERFMCDEEKLTSAIYCLINELFEGGIFDAKLNIATKNKTLTIKIISPKKFVFTEESITYCRKIAAIHKGVLFCDSNKAIFKLPEKTDTLPIFRSENKFKYSEGINSVLTEFAEILEFDTYILKK